ncbi:MAG: HPr family phosphocarrier protein [Lachnospiraceae bacterium]|nr:HPr family phosphocarrier protein [Lachnospiraceae bacterium]
MQKKEITVKLKRGVNARPAAMLVQVASRYRSEIHVEMENKKMNAKSIMGMMALGLDYGETVTIITNGEDEEAAVAGIEAFLTQKEI